MKRIAADSPDNRALVRVVERAYGADLDRLRFGVLQHQELEKNSV
jgi:hypothetical protein